MEKTWKERAEACGLDWRELWADAYKSLSVQEGLQYEDLDKKTQSLAWSHVRHLIHNVEKAGKNSPSKSTEPMSGPAAPPMDETPRETPPAIPVQPSPETKQERVPIEENGRMDLIPISTTPSGPLAIVQNAAENMDIILKAMDKIRMIAREKVRKMPPKNFVIFGENVCLKGHAIDEFISGMPLPVKITQVTELPESKSVNGYPVYRYQAMAVNELTGMGIPIYAEESSEKGFYCTRGGKKRKPEEMDNLRDVRMAAHRGLRKEMVKAFFGLRGLDVESAKAAGIAVEKIKRAK